MFGAEGTELADGDLVGVGEGGVVVSVEVEGEVDAARSDILSDLVRGGSSRRCLLFRGWIPASLR